MFGAGIEVGHLAAGMVISEEYDPITGSVLGALQGDAAGKFAGGLASGTYRLVELLHVAIAIGEDELRAVRLAGAVLQVTCDEFGAAVLPSLGPVEPAGAFVGAETRPLASAWEAARCHGSACRRMLSR